MPRIQTLTVGEMGVNCYLAENPEDGRTVVIDPGAEGREIIRALGDRIPVAVLLTHGHFDHIGAVDEICGQYQIPLYLHPADFSKLTDPKKNAGLDFGKKVTVQTLPLPLEEGQTLQLGGMCFTVWHTPGHSAGSCCFLAGEQCVFTGDTLFKGGYGRYDFEDGDFVALRQSLRRLMSLCPRRAAWPGHGEPAWAGREERP